MSNSSKYDRLLTRWEAKQDRWDAVQDRWDAKKAKWAEEEAARPETLAKLKAHFEERFGHRDDFEERWEARKERIEDRWDKQDARREEQIERWKDKAEEWEKTAEEWEERLDKYRPEPEPEPQPKPEPEPAPDPDPEPEPDPQPAPQPQVLTTYTSGLGTHGVTSAFNITVDFLGSAWTTDLQSAFIVASDYLSSLIVGDVQDVMLRNGTVIDDLSITAELISIDGSGGILGRAGPTAARNQNSVDDWLPVTGLMEYDMADAQWLQNSGLLDDVVAHEMMHALGFGTMWQLHAVTEGSIATGDLVYTGANAVLAYKAELNAQGVDTGGIDAVPLEMDGGPGTAGSHWDEQVFTTELMTGWLNPGAQMSAMSVASLEDMGYDTIFDPDNPDAPIPQVDEFQFV